MRISNDLRATQCRRRTDEGGNSDRKGNAENDWAGRKGQRGETKLRRKNDWGPNSDWKNNNGWNCRPSNEWGILRPGITQADLLP